MKRLAIALGCLLLVAATPAQAETVYRYWSYWQADAGSWQFAQVGVGSVAVADGQVQGWRFITSVTGSGSELAPRSSADFSEICEGVVAPKGKVRVGLVIDYGDASDYPGAGAPPKPVSECVLADAGISSAVVLADHVEIRANNGFVCGINQWPKSGCGEAVDSATADGQAQQDQLARWVTLGLGLILFLVTWRGLMRQKGWSLRR